MPEKVLFINQETVPYVPESALSTMGRVLPEQTQEAGYEIRTFMPRWGVINERRGQLHEVIRLSGVNLVVNDTDHPLLIKVASLPKSRVQVYFIDNDEFFSRRKMTVDSDGTPFKDNGDRTVFFVRGVLETMKKLRWAPDVIVCQGWMTALVPLYVKVVYGDEPCLAETKVITTVWDNAFAGTLEDTFKKSIEYREVTADTLAKYQSMFDFAELMRLAMDYSDAIAVVAGADDSLRDYAIARGVPMRECHNDDYVSSVTALIKELISTK